MTRDGARIGLTALHGGLKHQETALPPFFAELLELLYPVVGPGRS